MLSLRFSHSHTLNVPKPSGYRRTIHAPPDNRVFLSTQSASDSMILGVADVVFGETVDHGRDGLGCGRAFGWVVGAGAGGGCWDDGEELCDWVGG